MMDGWIPLPERYWGYEFRPEGDRLRSWRKIGRGAFGKRAETPREIKVRLVNGHPACSLQDGHRRTVLTVATIRRLALGATKKEVAEC